MTWSIIARDEATGRVGIAVATRFFAVGSRVPYIKTGVGAIATQAFVNPYFGPQGLALLQAGASADDAVRLLTKADAGRDNRQLHIMDRHGRFAAFTGAACVDWCGHRLGETYSIAGNMLSGESVLAETAAAYEQARDHSFARRLIRAMIAGEAVGGDKRGRQSAALLVHDDQDYSFLDLRVDDHPDPLAELARLEAVSRERWIHFRRHLPSRDNPSGLLERTDIDALIQRSKDEGYH
jgi:uncharacterized Ntn-hydrolase superfamily protein